MVFLSKSYAWGTGAQYSVPADVVGRTLESIEERDGKITKESFLEESRPLNAPTHALFEWDDEKAAEKYRLVQSGRVINNLVVKLETNENDVPLLARAVVNVAPEGLKRASYISTTLAFQTESGRDVVLKHALRELETFKNKYSNLEELAEVFKAMEKLKTA